MKTDIIIDLLIILVLSSLIGEIFKHFINTKEAFINPSHIIKKCNKMKRKTRAKIYNYKNILERNIKDKVDNVYKSSKNTMKKILFPKEIKISF